MIYVSIEGDLLAKVYIKLANNDHYLHVQSVTYMGTPKCILNLSRPVP